MSGRVRTTRLSSGSVKKRNYNEGMESSESDEYDSDEVGRAKRREEKKREAALMEDDDDDDDSEDAFEPERKKRSRVGGGRGHRQMSDSYSSDDDDDDDDDEEEDSEDSYEDTDSEDDKKRRRKSSAKSTPKGKRATSSAATTPSNVSVKRYQDYSNGVDIVRAPTDVVPARRISEHLLSFMQDLQDPAKNDRDWFAAHKNVYDYIHKNWLTFTATCVDEMIEHVDDTIAWMQPKDLIERIYRDVRFSNDKTPYKRHLSWCMSRQGRKGNYAKYYLAVSANGGTGLHAGHYESTKEDLETFRHHITQNTLEGRALRELVKDKAFIKAFGAPPKSNASPSYRSSLWGSSDQLKRAPKGYDPDDRDAQWLRLKSFTVSHKFSDAEVIAPDFLDKVLEVAFAARPLVELLNEMLHGPPPTGPAVSAE